MTKLERIQSRVTCYTAKNVDTDQIIPARFLKRIDKTGFGDQLFADLKPAEIYKIPMPVSARSSSPAKTSVVAAPVNTPSGPFATLAFAS